MRRGSALACGSADSVHLHQVIANQIQQLTMARLEPVLRSVLMKLHFADAHLQPLPSGGLVTAKMSSVQLCQVDQRVRCGDGLILSCIMLTIAATTPLRCRRVMV